MNGGYYDTGKLPDDDRQTDVLFEIVLRDLLIPEYTTLKLIETQSYEQKKKLIKQHTKFQTCNSERGKFRTNNYLDLKFSGSLDGYKSDVDRIIVTLRTANKKEVENFLGQSGNIFLDMLYFCACKQPKSFLEAQIVKSSLQCISLISNNSFGLGRLGEIPRISLVLALCIDCNNPLIGDPEPQRTYDLCICNTIDSLEILIRFAWRDKQGSKVILNTLKKVGKIRRNVGGPLFLLLHDYENSPLRQRNPSLLLRLGLKIFVFFNSLIELEDDVYRRNLLRNEIREIGFISTSKNLLDLITEPVNKVLMEFIHELKTQLEIFHDRQKKDLDALYEESGFSNNNISNNWVKKRPPAPTKQEQPKRKSNNPPPPRPPAPLVPTTTITTTTTPTHVSEKNNVYNEQLWKQVVQFLSSTNLLQYQENLKQNGYDTMERLSLADKSDLLFIGMKHGHAKSLLVNLKMHVIRNMDENKVTTLGGGGGGRGTNTNATNVGILNHQTTFHTNSFNQPFKFKIIPRGAIVVNKLIGKGSFGNVYLAEYQGATVVVKKIKRTVAISGDSNNNNNSNGARKHEELTSKMILEEAEAMEMSKNHPHVVTLYGVCLDAQELMLVSEYCELGSLYDSVVRPKPRKYKIDYILQLAKQGVSGLVHLHSLGVVHRDIAARNFLLDSRGIVKVCDFGLAKIKTNKTYVSYYSSKGGINPLKWAAPESLEKNSYSTASDCYMCGVFLWELWMGETPFADLDNFQAAFQVINGKRPFIPTERRMENPKLANLLGLCWKKEPDLRPNMQTIMQQLGTMLLVDKDDFSNKKMINTNNNNNEYTKFDNPNMEEESFYYNNNTTTTTNSTTSSSNNSNSVEELYKV